MGRKMENKINDYFEKQTTRKKLICLKLRNIILKTFPEIKEEYKWGAVVYDNGRFYIGAVRRGVNLGFAINGLTPEEIKFFKGTGKTMRHLKFESITAIDEEIIINLLNLVKTKAVLQAL